jgi:hypothetical protein
MVHAVWDIVINDIARDERFMNMFATTWRRCINIRTALAVYKTSMS